MPQKYIKKNELLYQKLCPKVYELYRIYRKIELKLYNLVLNKHQIADENSKFQTNE